MFINVFITIISIIGILFLNGLFLALGLGNVFFVVSLILLKNIKSILPLLLVVILSLLIDGVYYNWIGVTLFSITSTFLISRFLESVLPQDKLITNVIYIVLISLFYNLLYLGFIALKDASGFSFISWDWAGFLLIQTIKNAILLFILDYFVNHFIITKQNKSLFRFK